MRLFYGILLVLVLGASVVHSQDEGTTLQKVLSFVLQKPYIVDGLTGKVLQDFAWVHQVCTGKSNVSHVSSEILPVDSIRFTTIHNTLLSATIERELEASLTKENLFLYIRQTFTLQVVTTGKLNGNATELVFTIKKEANVPVDAIEYSPITWEGTLETHGAYEYHFYDENLFDGAPATILHQPHEPKQGLLNLPLLVAEELGKVGLRATSMDVGPSSFFTSTRGVFINSFGSNHIVKTTDGGMIELEGIDFIGGPRPVGSYARFYERCDENTCDTTILTTVKDIVVESSQHLCSDAELVSSSLVSELYADVFANEQTINPLSTYARTKALYRCGGGYIGVQFTASSISNVTWSTNVFMNNKRAAIGMVKAIPSRWTGNLYGSLTKGGQLYSTLTGNIFSSEGGGRFVKDFSLDYTTQLIEQSKSLLYADSSVLRALVTDVFNPHTVQQYKAETLRPTQVGFIEWFAAKNKLIPYFDKDGSILHLYVYITGNTHTTSMADDAVKATNAAIEDLGKHYRKKHKHHHTKVIKQSSQIKAMIGKGLMSRKLTWDFINNHVTVDEKISETFATVTIRAEFAQPDSIFTCVNSVYDYTKKAVIKVCLNPTAGVGSYTTFGLNGRLHKDSKDVVCNGLTTIAQIFDKKPEQIQWMERSLPSMNGINLDQMTDTGTWHSEIIKAKEACTSENVLEAAIQLEQYFHKLSQSTDTLILARVIPDGNMLDVTLETHRIVTIRIEDQSAWSMVATSRVPLPTVLSTKAHFKIASGDRSSLVPEIITKATTIVSHWETGVAYGMQQAIAEQSIAMIKIDLPTSAWFSIVAEAHVRNGTPVTIKIDSSNLLETTIQRPIIQLLTNNTQFVPPGLVYAGLTDMINIPSHQNLLDFSLPPLAHKIDSIMQWDHATTDGLEWITSHQETSLLASFSLCESDITIPMFNLSVNGISMHESIVPFHKYVQLQDIAAVLERTQLALYVTAKQVHSEEVEETCTVVGLYPSVPGVVYDLRLSGAKLDGSEITGTYAKKRNPTFSSWHDFATTMNLALGSPLAKPETKLVPASHADIPENLRHLYPAMIEGTFIDVSIGASFTNASADQQLVPSVTTHDGGVTLKLNHTGTGQVSLGSRLSFSYGVIYNIPALKNITAFSDLNPEEQTTLDTQIKKGNNTFTLNIEAHLRSESSITRLRKSYAIEIPPGMSFKDAMMNYVPSRIDELHKAILTVRVAHADPVLHNIDQIQFLLNRVQVQPRVYLLPVTFQVLDSTVPGLNDFYQSMLSAVPMVHDIEFLVEHEQTTEFDGVGGLLGVFDVRSDAVSSSGSLRMHVKQDKDFTTVAKAVGSMQDKSRLYNIFHIDMSTNSTLDLTGTALNTNSDLIDLSNIQLGHDIDRRITNNDQMTSIVKDLQKMEARSSFSTNQLSQVRNETFCTMLTEIVAKIDIALEKPEAVKPLPFISKSFGDIMRHRLHDPMAEIKTKVCEAATAFSLHEFCALLKKKWGQEICQATSVSLRGFGVTMQVEAHKQILHEQLHFNVKKIFASKLPIGFGTHGGLDIHSVLNFTFHMELNWEHFHVSINTSEISLANYIAADSAFKLQLGPLALSLGEAGIHQDTLFRVNMHRNDVQVYLDGNADFGAMVSIFDSSICRIHVFIPSVYKFITHEGKSWVVEESSCKNGSFVQAIEEQLSTHSLVKYFQDPYQFISQWERSIGQFMDKLFGHGPSSIEMIVVPLVDKLIQTNLKHELRKIFGPEATSLLVHETTSLVNELLMNHTIAHTMQDVEQQLLVGFTKLLCAILRPETCPEVPDVTQDEFQWTLLISRSVEKKVANIHFKVGNDAFADLETDTDLSFNMKMLVGFTLSYSKYHGVHIYLDQPQIVAATAELAFAPQSHFSGVFGFMGADIKTSDQSGLKAELFIKQDEKKQFVLAFTARAVLQGEAEIGFAGALAKKISHDKSIEALPHFVTNLEGIWEFDASDHMKPPIFKFENSAFCLGTVVGKLTLAVRREVGKVLDRLEPFVGKTGMLQKKVPVLSKIFGRKLTVAEFGIFLLEHYCHGSCHIENVREILNRFLQLYKLLHDLEELNHFFKDKDGCLATSEIGTFWSDLTHPSKVIENVPGPSTNITWNDPTIPPEKRMQLHATWNAIVQGHVGVSFPLFQEPKKLFEKMLMLIMGHDLDLIRVDLPKMYLMGGIHFNVYIWYAPPVKLFVQVGAGLMIHLPPIVYNTAGIRSALQTGRMANLVNGLGIVTKNDDGSNIWIATGFVKLTGGVSVSAFVLDARAHAHIQLSAKASLFSANGGRIVTFDEMFWLIKKSKNVLNVLTYQLALDYGFGFRLRACVHYIIGKKCWNIHHSEFTGNIFRKDFKPKKIATSLKSNNMDLHQAQLEGDYSRYELYSVHGAFHGGDIEHERAIPSLIDAISANAPVTFSGHPGTRNIDIAVHGVPSMVNLPPFDTVGLHYNLGAYQNASTFSISHDHILPNIGGNGIKLQNKCRKIVMHSPQSGTALRFDGVACTTHVNATMGLTMSFTGSVSNYHNKPIYVYGPASVQSTVQVSQLLISSQSIVGDQGAFGIYNSVPLPSILIQMNGVSSQVVITKVPKETSLAVYCGGENDKFIVSDLHAIAGTVLVDGKGGDTNMLQVTIYTPPEGFFGVVSASSIYDQKSPHTVFMQNIQQRVLTIHGRDHVETVMSYLVMHDSVIVNSIGTGASNMTHVVNSCQEKTVLHYNMENGGNHNVVVGGGGRISSLRCRIVVNGTSADISKLVINSVHDNSLRYVVEKNIIQVYKSNTTARVLCVEIENMKQVVINTSKSEVIVNEISSSTQVSTIAYNERQVKITKNSNIIIINT